MLGLLCWGWVFSSVCTWYQSGEQGQKTVSIIQQMAESPWFNVCKVLLSKIAHRLPIAPAQRCYLHISSTVYFVRKREMIDRDISSGMKGPRYHFQQSTTTAFIDSLTAWIPDRAQHSASAQWYTSCSIPKWIGSTNKHKRQVHLELILRCHLVQCHILPQYCNVMWLD